MCVVFVVTVFIFGFASENICSNKTFELEELLTVRLEPEQPKEDKIRK
jgi:hypothetical protein